MCGQSASPRAAASSAGVLGGLPSGGNAAASQFSSGYIEVASLPADDQLATRLNDFEDAPAQHVVGAAGVAGTTIRLRADAPDIRWLDDAEMQEAAQRMTDSLAGWAPPPLVDPETAQTRESAENAAADAVDAPWVEPDEEALWSERVAQTLQKLDDVQYTPHDGNCLLYVGGEPAGLALYTKRPGGLDVDLMVTHPGLLGGGWALMTSLLNTAQQFANANPSDESVPLLTITADNPAAYEAYVAMGCDGESNSHMPLYPKDNDKWRKGAEGVWEPVAFQGACHFIA